MSRVSVVVLSLGLALGLSCQPSEPPATPSSFPPSHQQVRGRPALTTAHPTPLVTAEPAMVPGAAAPADEPYRGPAHAFTPRPHQPRTQQGPGCTHELDITTANTTENIEDEKETETSQKAGKA